MTYFTKQGFEEIQKELTTLQKRRPEAVNELQRARELGDLSENGAYKAARHELSTIDSRIRRIERQLQTAKVLSPKTDGTIGIGNSVVLKKEDKEITYEIVGDFEADPSKRKISSLSPLGKKLIGRSKGEHISIITPDTKVDYFIIEVR